jgi:replication factor C large subunit
VVFVTSSGESTNKVQSIVEDAEQLRENTAVEHSDGAFEGAVADGETDDGGTDNDPDTDQSPDDATSDDTQGNDTGESDDGQQSGLSDFV